MARLRKINTGTHPQRPSRPIDNPQLEPSWTRHYHWLTLSDPHLQQYRAAVIPDEVMHLPDLLTMVDHFAVQGITVRFFRVPELAMRWLNRVTEQVACV